MGRRRESQRPRKTLAIVATAAVLSVALAVGLFLGLSSGSGPSARPKTAAIVDQLSLTQRNPDFVNAASSVLEQAGYVVDYYPGQEVTVDLYSNLPTRGYDLILLRVHSGMAQNLGRSTGYVSLFSSEQFSETKYAREISVGLLGRASYYDGGSQYFGIVPAFMQSMMVGKFDGATVVLMGCHGLHTANTARALDRQGRQGCSGLERARVGQPHGLGDRAPAPAPPDGRTQFERGSEPGHGRGRSRPIVWQRTSRLPI